MGGHIDVGDVVKDSDSLGAPVVGFRRVDRNWNQRVIKLSLYIDMFELVASLDK